MIRSWSCPPDRSSYSLLFCFSLLFSSFEIYLLLHNGLISAFPNKIFSSTYVIFKDTFAPPVQFSSQRKTQYTSFLSGYEPRGLIYTSAGTREQRPTEFKFYKILEERSLHSQVRGKFGKSSSASTQRNRIDVYRVLQDYSREGTASRYHVQRTVRVRSPVSRFHARISYLIKYCFHATRKRHTTVPVLSHAKLFSTLFLRCAHEEKSQG